MSRTIALVSTTRGSMNCCRLNAKSCLVSFCGAACRVVDRFRSSVNGRTTVNFVLKQFGLSQDHSEQVIEVVRDATGQPADRVHFLDCISCLSRDRRSVMSSAKTSK